MKQKMIIAVSVVGIAHLSVSGETSKERAVKVP